MITRNKAKLINSLRISKYRKKHGLFIAEGTKLVLELLKSSFGIYEIYATSDWITAFHDDFRQVDHLVASVDQREIDEVSSLSTPPQVMALIEMPQLKFDASMLAGSITLMLDGINDPGNLGSIIRSADWFGIDQIVCSLNTVDVFHPKVVQATMGSVFRMNVYETDLVRALSAHSADIEVYGAFMDGASIYQTRLNTAAIYIIGSESHGISQAVAGYVDHRVSIPRFAADTGTSETESLNAAVAAAIILAEIRRPER